MEYANRDSWQKALESKIESIYTNQVYTSCEFTWRDKTHRL